MVPGQECGRVFKESVGGGRALKLDGLKEYGAGIYTDIFSGANVLNLQGGAPNYFEECLCQVIGAVS